MGFKIVSREIIDSPNLVLFVQGSWEIGKNDRNLAAQEALKSSRIASTILYESTRDWIALNWAETEEDWIRAFDGKDYHEELDDLNRVIKHLNKGIKPRNLYLSGYSYGGGLAALVSGTDLTQSCQGASHCPSDCSFFSW